MPETTNTGFGMLTPGQIATLACNLEVAAPKVGNVHRGIDFVDMTLNDFLVSASLLGGAIDFELARAEEDGGRIEVGRMILQSVSATAEMVGTNTNLGLSLLLCPLAAAALRRGGKPLTSQDVRSVLDELDSNDSRLVYQAIERARPGGLGTVDAMDLQSTAPDCLLTAMRSAADRDMIAAQFGNGMDDVFHTVAPKIVEANRRFRDLSHAIVYAQIELMAAIPDSLIARKCGEEAAQHGKMLAGKAIDTLNESEQPSDFYNEPFQVELSGLDFWLRSDGNRRNPGTTADLIGAGLFVALVNRELVNGEPLNNMDPVSSPEKAKQE